MCRGVICFDFGGRSASSFCAALTEVGHHDDAHQLAQQARQRRGPVRRDAYGSPTRPPPRHPPPSREAAGRLRSSYPPSPSPPPPRACHPGPVVATSPVPPRPRRPTLEDDRTALQHPRTRRQDSTTHNLASRAPRPGTPATPRAPPGRSRHACPRPEAPSRRYASITCAPTLPMASSNAARKHSSRSANRS